MKISQGYIKTIKDAAKEFDSKSHELLVRAGFIDQVASGIYALLPPGDRVLRKIEDIIRQGMRSVGAEEVRLPSLQPKKLWETTDRWNHVDILFKVASQHGQEYALGPTHEEIITPLAQKYIESYRDLPLALYQIGTKFRDEARAKSGILRGREFGMKDMYSFHADQKDLVAYYKKVTHAYTKIFKQCGFPDVKITEASGGDFTKKHSHEFNVITPAGEVDLVYCDKCDFTQNDELINKELKKCPSCGSSGIQKNKAIEIGNTRLLGAVVEVHHDDKGIIWPESITPFHAHLVNLVKDDTAYADLVYRTLTSEGLDIIYDDRLDCSAGEKFATADLIGAPIRLVVSKKTKQGVELKFRDDKNERVFATPEIVKLLKDHYSL